MLLDSMLLWLRITNEVPMRDTTIYLTTAELAELLRCSRRTVYRWRDNNYGPKPRLIGGKYLYPLREVESWASDRMVNA